MLRSSLPSPSTLIFLSGRRCFPAVAPASLLNIPGKPPECSLYRHRPFHLCSSGTHDIAEAVRVLREDGDEGEPAGVSEFIEVGYISSSHGLKGELRVKPNTGFPELRFCKSGTRWIRTRIFGRETISEMQLTGGRSHPGQKCWIISFEGIDTVDKAKQIVGSTLLVKEEDRPELEEDEFYTNDLVGMRVFDKETGMLVGTVANVFNSGANDLLHVMRASCSSNKDGLDHTYSTLSEIDASRQFVWIPFVEAIVPEIDTTKREMYITPPKGLLELNLRNDMRSKKQRRHEEWRQKKKLHQRLMAAKKKLHELGQSHVLDGFNFGEKDEKIQLATQIVDINFLLFQHALLSIERSSKRLSFYDFLEVNSASLSKKALRVPYQNLIDCAYPERIDELHNEGLQLLRSSKVAIVLVINGEKSLECLQQVLLNIKTFLKYGENHFEIPLIMIASTDQLQICEDLFSQNDYFGFNDQKVFFLPEAKLPIISRGSNKILLKSAWEILQAPVGSGGIFASISSQKCVDLLYEMGIEYVEVCCLRERCALGIPLFFGWASSCRANMALKIFDDKREDSEEEKDYDIIFSTEYLCQITKQPEALHFHAIPEQYEHVELVDGQWLQISPGPNSHRLHCSIYDALYSCSLYKISILQIS